MSKLIIIFLLFVGCSPLAAENCDTRLTVREYVIPSNAEFYETEIDGYFTGVSVCINVNQTALIAIDTWDLDKLNLTEGWEERASINMVGSLLPLYNLMRRNHIEIIHAPAGNNIAPTVAPLADELVLGPYQHALYLDNYLQNKNITTLLYAGYASNMCLLFRPAGIVNMSRLGYQIIFIRDCSIAIETYETLGQEWMHYAATIIIERSFGSSTTLNDLYDAFDF